MVWTRIPQGPRVKAMSPICGVMGGGGPLRRWGLVGGVEIIGVCPCRGYGPQTFLSLFVLSSNEVRGALCQMWCGLPPHRPKATGPGSHRSRASQDFFFFFFAVLGFELRTYTESHSTSLFL
jgi:hypothetical protein